MAVRALYRDTFSGVGNGEHRNREWGVEKTYFIDRVNRSLDPPAKGRSHLIYSF